MVGVVCLVKGVQSWSGVPGGGGPGSWFFFPSGIALSWERGGVKAVASGESWDAPWSSGPGSSPPARAARALEVRA